jgi:hypothetical protein
LTNQDDTEHLALIRQRLVDQRGVSEEHVWWLLGYIEALTRQRDDVVDRLADMAVSYGNLRADLEETQP